MRDGGIGLITGVDGRDVSHECGGMVGEKGWWLGT